MIVTGCSAVLFFLLVYFVYQIDEAKRVGTAVPKYSANEFIRLNEKITERYAILSDERKKLAAETEKIILERRTDLQKKIFQQKVSKAIQKTITPSLAPTPVKTSAQTTNRAPAVTQAPKPAAIPRPRTTVS